MPASCLWLDCATPGPYADPKTLFEHVNATHTPEGKETGFACRWYGCGNQLTAGSEQERWLSHLRLHSAYKPFVCAVPGCEHASVGARGLAGHTRGAHAHGAYTVHVDIRCGWHGCDADALPDAPALFAHLLAEHRPSLARDVRCGWRGCGYAFSQRNYLSHLEGHCPLVYPCPECGIEYRSRTGLKNHVVEKHPAEVAESEGGSASMDPIGDGSVRKRGAEDSADGPAARRPRVDNADETQSQKGQAGRGAIDSASNDESEAAGLGIHSNEKARGKHPGRNAPMVDRPEQVQRTIEELVKAKLLAESRVRELEACLRAVGREEWCKAADGDDWEYST